MTKTAQELEAEALANCDKDPISTPGHIQSFGCLIGLNKTVDNVIYVSENIDALLGINAKELLHTKPSDFLPFELIHSIRNIVSRSTSTYQRELVGKWDKNGVSFSIAGHVKNDIAIIEISKDGDDPIQQINGLDRLRWITSKINHEASLNEIIEDAVVHLRSFSGFDRVKAYRFRPDNSGEIIAEDKTPFMDSFLGLRFPEFDIPPQARKLYLQTPIRIICDVNEEPIGLLTKGDAPDLDMSLAALRGTMPVHTQYLKNMGVGATMTLPIVVRGKLWGLFAFHHQTPRYIGGGIDLAIEFAGQYLNMVISSALTHLENQKELDSIRIANIFFSRKDNKKATNLAWNNIQQDLLKFIPADGIAFQTPDATFFYGDCPPESSLNAISNHLKKIEDGIKISDSLTSDIANIKPTKTAGALEIFVSDFSVFFFRKSAETTVDWAGAPEKNIEHDQEGVRLTPRGSFAAYKASTNGKSDGWETNNILAARGLRSAMARAHTEFVNRDALMENLELVVQELNHRVRNILALVQSIVKQTNPKLEGIEEHFIALEARILSLAGAHNILSQNGSSSLDLKASIEQEAKPYSVDRINVSGSKIGIDSRAASVFVLVIHELFSNAAKYGALSNQVGILNISWTLDTKGLQIHWVERGGPPVTKPEKSGFGSTLILGAFSYEFGGDAEINHDPNGVQVKLFIPDNLLTYSKTNIDGSSDDRLQYTNKHGDTVSIGNVLILEDDYLIAMQTKQEIDKIGATKSLMASNNADAIKIIGLEKISLAILDINLAGERSSVVAQLLTERGIPFLFVTGYDSGEETMNTFPNITIIKKPYDQVTLKEEIFRTLMS